MKKLLSVLLVLIMTLTMVACTAKNDPQESETTTEAESKVELSRGKFNGDVYTNEFLEFSFTKPATWIYSTDEEIASMVNLGAEAILGENFKETLEKSASIYDMLVVDSVTRTNISVGYENLAKNLATNITIEQYVDALKRQFESVPSMTVTFPDTYETATLGKTEFTKVVCSTSTQGVTMTQIYYLKKVDVYMTFIIVTIPSGYTASQIEAMFK